MARKKTKSAARAQLWISTGLSTAAFIGFLVYLSNQPEPDTRQAINLFNRSSIDVHTQQHKTVADNHPVRYTFYRDLPEMEVMVKDINQMLPPAKSVDHSTDLPTDSAAVEADLATPIAAITTTHVTPSVTPAEANKTVTTPTTAVAQTMTSKPKVKTLAKFDTPTSVAVTEKPADKKLTREKTISAENAVAIRSTPTETNHSKTKEETNDNTYALQTDAFRTLADADRRRAELLLMGFNARIQQTQAKGTIWYRVLVGPFADRNALSKTQGLLAQNNISASVRTVNN